MGDAMKFGIQSGLWMARWTDDITPILRTVADLGFDGVGISLLGMSDEKADALAGLIRDHGLEVTCSDGLSKAADIASSDPAVRVASSGRRGGASRSARNSGSSVGNRVMALS
jgi:D-psicose/D-tagatose/L-ribulose 3-epimerase